MTGTHIDVKIDLSNTYDTETVSKSPPEPRSDSTPGQYLRR